MSNLFHEINALHRVVIFSNITSDKVETVVERIAQNSQSFFFLEVLAAKLFEGWRLIKRDYYRSQLSKYYHNLLNESGKEALIKLKRYFDRSNNLIGEVRNRYVFHYSSESSEKILDQIRKLQDEDSKDKGSIYLSELTSNCFFPIAEIIVTNAILQEIEPDDEWKALDKFFKETLEVSRLFLNFFKAITYVIILKMDMRAALIDIPDPLPLKDILMPYFLREDTNP
jgi:hypothetical protein